MNKYIDAKKLITEIERRIQFCEDCERDGYPDTTSSEATLKSLRSFINSLQQEQPECIYGRTLEERKKCCKFCSAICEARIEQEKTDKYETALEKAREWMPNVNQGGHAMLIDIFPELGEGLDTRYGGRKQQPEVDLEKEIHRYLREECSSDNEPSISEIAHHFWNKGYNARKEE